jgi:Glycogen recognition site of AMP-activated protein kinase
MHIPTEPGSQSRGVRREPRGQPCGGGGVLRQLDDAAADAALRQGLHHREAAAARRLPGVIPRCSTALWSSSGAYLPEHAVAATWPAWAQLISSRCSYVLTLCMSLAWMQYKFVVDGEWKYAPDQAAMYDEGGNVNNVLEVQEYVPENLDSLSGFDPPPSPPSR